jgi:opacity protein-like surface antigen
MVRPAKFIRSTLITAIAVVQMSGIALAGEDTISIINPGFEDYTEFSIFGYNFEYSRFYRDWIADHFELTLRFSDYNFKRRFSSGEYDEYFIGSIDSIEPEGRGYGLHNLNLTWFPWARASQKGSSRVSGIVRLLEGVGLEIGWDEVRAKTVVSASSTRPAYSDGTIVAEGPSISYIFQIRNPTVITPYFGIGTIFYSTSVTSGWWHYGFRDETAYREWRQSGSQGDPTDGWRRSFKVSDDNGLSWYAGAAVRIYANWSLDLFYRSTDVQFDNRYEISSRGEVADTRYSKWDLSSETYGIGVRYTF